MHTSSLLVVALAAASTLAVEDRPRIYFPRQVKRQFLNASITSHRPHPPPEPTDETTTKRQTSLLDFFPSDPFGHGFSTSRGPSGSKPGSTGTSGSSSGSGVTTVIVPSTVVVSPGGTPTDTPVDTSASDTSNGAVASSGGVPPLIVLPTLSLGLGLGSGTTSSANSTGPSTGPATGPASTDPTTSSNSEILLAPTGIVTTSTSTPGLLAPIGSLVSSVVSQVTSILDPTTTPNVTVSDPAVQTPPTTTTTPPLIDISLTVPPIIDPTTTPNVTISTTTTPPPDTTPPPPPPTSNTTTYPPPTSMPNTTDVTTPPPDTTPPTTVPTTLPPTSLPTTLPPDPTNTNSSLTNSTLPPTPTPTDTLPLTSLPPTNTITNSQSWLPSTMIQQPTLTSPNPTGLAPTTATGLPTGLPKAITPDTANGPIPDDTIEIQMGFLYGLNYPFVATNPKSAAQVLNTMPGLLEYQGGFPPGKVFVRRLLPLDTSNQLGYVTMLCILTYPAALFDQLRLDMRLPAAPLWNNPNELAYNMSLQINPAIDIAIGSTLDWNPDGAPGSPGSTSVSNPNDVFNQGDGSSQSPQQKGIVASVAVGAVVVAGAYGAAMFIIARRYKKKKQSHHRSSSVTNPSTMRQTGSPALMGGALLSRDFTSNYGGVAGGRDSHNSHGSHGTQGSGMNNSGRTAYISAPVAAENSLGWN